MLTTLYIRLPLRSTATRDGWSPVELPFALANPRGDTPLQQGRAAVADLPEADSLTLIVPAPDVTLLSLEVPPLSDTRMRQALPNLVEDSVAQDVQHCHLAIAPAGMPSLEGTAPRRSVAVIDRAWLRQVLDALKSRPYRTCKVVAAQSCLPPPADGGVTLLLDLAEADNPADPAAGLTLCTRAGSASDGDAVSGLGLRLAAPPEGTPPGDLWQAAAHLAGISADSPMRRLVTPEARERLGMHGDETIDWSAWIEGARTTTLDLCQYEFGARSSSRGWHTWRWAAAVACGILMVQLIGMHADWWQLRKQHASLQAQMEQMLRDAVPSVPVIVDAPLQLRRHVEQLRTASGLIANDDFIVLGDQLGQLLADAPAGTLQALDYRNGAILATFRSGFDAGALAARAAQFGLRMQQDNGKWRIQPAS